MINAYKTKSLVAVCLLLVTSSVLATNTWFAREGAVAHMTPEDVEILTSTIDNALNNSPDGTVVEWSNPETAASGKVSVGKTHQDYGTTCRLMRMQNNSKGISRSGNYRLCKDQEGAWRFAPMQRSE